MEPKRELTSVDLRALTRELTLSEAVVDKVYLYGDRSLRFKLRDYERDRGRVELFVRVGDRKGLHTVAPDRVPEAPERPPEFATQLRNRISGANLVGVEQYGFDRVVRLEFERPDGDTAVVAELFGDGNAAVLNGNGETVACLETVRLKSRTVAPGAPYEYPGERVDPLALDRDAFVAAVRDSDTDLVRTLATQLNFGGLYAEELCTRAGVEKTVSVAAATDEQVDALYDAVVRLDDELGGDLDPRVYYDEDDGDGSEPEPDDDAADGVPGRPVDATPVPLREYEDGVGDPDRTGLAAESRDTFDGAVATYFRRAREFEATVEATPDRPDFESEVAKFERIIEQQEGAIEQYEAEAAETREKAETLYAEYDLVDEVLSTVRAARREGRSWEAIEERLAEGRERGIAAAAAVADLDPSEGVVTVAVGDHRIDLDASEGVEHNADRLYREAKSIEEKAEGAAEALADSREQLAAVKERRERWAAGETESDDVDADDDEPVDWLSRSSVPVRAEEQWYERFRWFRTSEDFLVLGGRNAKQNEELVEKYLESGDLFLHAQSHGGPATVLKAAGPSESARDVTVPERSRAEAARFAVSYSSVWKAGQYSDDVYLVDHDQVTKTPESGEYLATGGFAVRGDRTYFEDTPVDVAVGVQCEPSTRAIGGPADPVEERAETTMRVEPGRFAQGDVAKRVYREFRERFADESFVRKVASPDRIQHFLPPGTSRIAEE
ncbi:hypothetical protein BRD18_08170 [Halobacteriales archaeon SW_7_71_33]|nr:MAG: hypothetical protein BRD18_08170 [Halobacteriales archaeon SW_7_71_33]